MLTNQAKGIAFKVISAALFAVMQALIRYLGARYPVGQVVFYRSVFAIIPVVLVFQLTSVHRRACRAHLGRARARLPLVGGHHRICRRSGGALAPSFR
jgi:drug/metabolite transporter (DMT)-like permease